MPTHMGLDIHRRVCHATVLQGEGVYQERFPTTPEELKHFLSRLACVGRGGSDLLLVVNLRARRIAGFVTKELPQVVVDYGARAG